MYMYVCMHACMYVTLSLSQYLLSYLSIYLSSQMSLPDPMLAHQHITASRKISNTALQAHQIIMAASLYDLESLSHYTTISVTLRLLTKL